VLSTYDKSGWLLRETEHMCEVKVSIIIPTYNRPDFLEKLLSSIVRQTFQDYEVIVVDDSSQNIEGYRKVIEHFAGVMNIGYFRNDNNMGAPFSRNRGIKAAKGKYIALVDDDDDWLPEKLEKQVTLFEKSPKRLGMVYTWADAVDIEGNIVYQYRSTIQGNAVKEILADCFIPSPTVMVKQEFFKKAGFFDDSFPSCQDWDMWTRILSLGCECDVIKEVLAIYHKHELPTIGKDEKAKDGYLKYYKKHYSKYVEHKLFDLITAQTRGLSKFYRQKRDLPKVIAVQILNAKIGLLRLNKKLGFSGQY
jgi:glycosyltransferase involved in cell wall biosynthesis